MDGQPSEGSVSQPPVPGYPQPAGGTPTGYGAPAPYGSANPYGPPTAYGSPAGYGYAPPGYYGAVAGSQRNDLGIWALILGILSLVSGLLIVTGIPAIIVGNMSKRAVARGEANNAGMGTAGVVLGWIAVGISVVGLLAVLAFMALIASVATTTSVR